MISLTELILDTNVSLKSSTKFSGLLIQPDHMYAYYMHPKTNQKYKYNLFTKELKEY